MTSSNSAKSAIDRLQWYNEPPDWSEQDGVICVTAGAKTDFWRKTHYGFIRDNGHFYYQQVSGNFTVEVKFTGQYKTLYDQAGLMIRKDETTWMKCGIEYVGETQNASAVVTRDYSDWSVTPLTAPVTSLWLKAERKAEAIEIYYSLNGETYQLLRLACLTEENLLQVGVMCAAPEGGGFSVQFEQFRITSHEQ